MVRALTFGFIGAGSIGSLFGGCLSLISSEKYRTRVVLFGREGHVEAISREGLIVVKGDERLICPEVKAFTSMEYFEKARSGEIPSTFDFLFLTTKAHAIDAAMREYKELVKSCEALVILQNGVGNEERVKTYCDEGKIIRALTTEGANLIKWGTVVHTGRGITKIGFPFQSRGNKEREQLRTLKEIFESAEFETIIVEDIQKECWEKIFVNIGINAIGALTRLRNGEMLEVIPVRRLMEESVKEAVMMAKKGGFSVEDKDHVAAMIEVARKTARNQNSMLQDVLKGKKTEIDFINGKIVEIAEKLGMNAPINAMLTALIKGLERSMSV